MATTSADHLIGREIETRCGKCKTETLHTITKVKKDGSIAKVICNACQNEHVYRDKTAAKPAAKPARPNAQPPGVKRIMTRSTQKLAKVR